MPRTLSWASATIVQCMLESVLYGIALILFILSIRTLLRKLKRHEPVNRPLVIVAPFLFFFASIHVLGVTWIRSYKAFITYPEGPEAYLTLITTPEKTLGQAGQISSVAIADLMSVYRCWAIWDRNWFVIIVPTLTLVATFVSSVVFVTIQHHVDVQTSIFNATVTRWTEAWLASSLCTTGICTALIIYKLANVHLGLRRSGAELRTVSRTRQSITSRIILIVVESAAIYSANNLLYCVLYSVQQVPETWFSNMEGIVASITFSLIIIRVDHALAEGIDISTSTGRSNRARVVPLGKPIAIQVRQTSETIELKPSSQYSMTSSLSQPG